MPKYEKRPGDAVLFPNDNTNDKAPVYAGTVVAHRRIEPGEELRLAFWQKDGRRGAFLSGKMSDPQERKERPVFDRTKSARDDEDPLVDENIPF